MMNLNNPNSQGYWFVLREDQSNVLLSSTNNFTIQQNQQLINQEARYIVDTGGGRQYIQLNDNLTGPGGEGVNTENIEAPSTTTHKGDVQFWDRNKIKQFLALCLENNLKNVNKQKELVEVIASRIGTTPYDCLNKYKNLRRTFIRLFKKKRIGKDIKWVHYNICEKVFSECKSLPASVLDPWDENKVKNLLDLYIENLDRFRSTECLQKDVWKDIAAQLASTEYNCYHKFKNMKRVYFKWKQRSRETNKPIKWPYIQYFERIFLNFSPNVGPWSRNKTRKLMDAYLQMTDKFKSRRYQKRDLWKEISVVVGESAADCDKKFRNLKQTYMKLRTRSELGRSLTKWRYYKDFDAIYQPDNDWEGQTTKVNGEDYVRRLLSFYIDNIEKFRDPRIKKKHVWRTIGPKLGLSSEDCDRKFRNLKQTYLRLVERKAAGGRTSYWPYFPYFARIFLEPRERCARADRARPRAAPHTDNFHKLATAMEESNQIQRERNDILMGLLRRYAT